MQPDSAKCHLFCDERFALHQTGTHPESPLRILTLADKLSVWSKECLPKINSSGPAVCQLKLDSEWTELNPAYWRAIKTAHSSAYLHQLEQFALHGGGRWDADTVISPDSWEVAVQATRQVLTACDAVLTGKARTALSLHRPPGHHALADQAMGFCLLNHVAIAACYLQQVYGLKRILIIDWDVHHGNGTQDLFYDDSEVFFFSAHRHPFYPGTGLKEETGTAAGLGTTCNLPMKFGLSREMYLEQFRLELETFADRARPECLLISAGFDAHQLDPIGSLGLETADFAELTKIVQSIADTHCRGQLVSLLEGGYHLQSLADCVIAHFEQLCQTPA